MFSETTFLEQLVQHGNGGGRRQRKAGGIAESISHLEGLREAVDAAQRNGCETGRVWRREEEARLERGGMGDNSNFRSQILRYQSSRVPAFTPSI